MFRRMTRWLLCCSGIALGLVCSADANAQFTSSYWDQKTDLYSGWADDSEARSSRLMDMGLYGSSFMESRNADLMRQLSRDTARYADEARSREYGFSDYGSLYSQDFSGMGVGFDYSYPYSWDYTPSYYGSGYTPSYTPTYTPSYTPSYTPAPTYSYPSYSPPCTCPACQGYSYGGLNW